MSRFNSMIPVSLVIALLLFFLAELKLFGLDEHLRATNQVLILFALLILPFVLISMPAFVQSLTLKVSDKEFHVQLSELEETFTGNLGKVERVSTAEQSLWPILAGEDYKSDQRLSARIRKIIIGSKMDPSQMFFTELLAQSIEKWVPDTECEIRYPNGGSLRNFAGSTCISITPGPAVSISILIIKTFRAIVSPIRISSMNLISMVKKSA